MCQVYIIEQAETGYIKIGISEDVQKRLAALQTANPHKLTLRYILTCPTTQDAQTIEHMLHQRYSDWRKSGEWFDVDADEAISEIQWSIQFASHITGGTEFHIEVIQEVVTVREEIKPFGGSVWLGRLFETGRVLWGAVPKAQERRSVCTVCGAPIVQAKTGRPREYCSNRCKKALFEARQLAEKRARYG